MNHNKWGSNRVPEAGPPRQPGVDWSLAFTSGFTLLAGMLIGYYGGRFLDSRLGTAPWLTLVGIMLGVAAGFRILVRDILRGSPPTAAKRDAGARPGVDKKENPRNGNRGRG